MPRRNNELSPLAPYVMVALDWALFVVNGLGSIALHFTSKYFEAIRDSHPWSLYQAAKDKDIVRVKELLDKAPRDAPALARWRYEFLEYEDIVTGWSPLQVAASVGADNCIPALLAAGASHSHRDRWDRTALHLAVAAGEKGVASAQLLLNGGADPFVEDCKGYTSFDLSLNNDSRNAANVCMVRLIESRALYAGWASVKVVKLGGWRRMWEPRYLVISPRRHSPQLLSLGSGNADGEAPNPNFVLLTWFRSMTDFNVAGKAWLNGANVVIANREGEPELTLKLKSGHEKPSDAFVVTDPSMQHSLFFRGSDKLSPSYEALQKIADLAHSSSVGMEGGQAQPSSSSWAPSTNQTAEMAADERLAHRLQEEEYLRSAPGPISSHQSGPSSSQPSSSAAQQPQQSGVSASASVPPSAPSWLESPPGMAPELSSSGSNRGRRPPPPERLAQQMAAEEAQGRSRTSDETPVFLRPSAPPMTAPAAMLYSEPRSNNDGTLCVICSDAPAVAGFLHGSSMHLCVCKSCAGIYKAPGGPNTCPMCRAPIQHIVMDVFSG